MENKNHTFFGQLEANDNKLNSNKVHQLKISQNKINHPKNKINQHKHVKINHTKTSLTKFSNSNKTKIPELLPETVSDVHKNRKITQKSQKYQKSQKSQKSTPPITMRLTIKLGKESLVTREVQTSSPDSIVYVDEKYSNDSDASNPVENPQFDGKIALKRDKNVIKFNEKIEKGKIDLKSVKNDVSKEKVKKEKKEKLKRSKIDLLRKHAKKQFKMY